MKSILGSRSLVSVCCQDFKGTCQGYFGKQRLLPVHRIPCQMRSAGAGLGGSCGLVGIQDDKVVSEPPGTHRASLGSLGWGLASSVQIHLQVLALVGSSRALPIPRDRERVFLRVGRETSSVSAHGDFPPTPKQLLGSCVVSVLGKAEHSQNVLTSPSPVLWI